MGFPQGNRRRGGSFSADSTSHPVITPQSTIVQKEPSRFTVCESRSAITGSARRHRNTSTTPQRQPTLPQHTPVTFHPPNYTPVSEAGLKRRTGHANATYSATDSNTRALTASLPLTPILCLPDTFVPSTPHLINHRHARLAHHE